MLCVIRFFGHIEHNWYALNKNNKNFFSLVAHYISH